MEYKRQGSHKSQVKPVIQLRRRRALQTNCTIGAITSWASLKQWISLVTTVLCITRKSRRQYDWVVIRASSLHTDEDKLWLVPSAKQRRDPCSVYSDLSMHHDWPVKKGLCSSSQSGCMNYRKCVSNFPSTWLATTTKAFFIWPIVAYTQIWVHRTRISVLLHRRY